MSGGKQNGPKASNQQIASRFSIPSSGGYISGLFNSDDAMQDVFAG